MSRVQIHGPFATERRLLRTCRADSLFHICKPLDRFCEAGDRLIHVTVFDAIPDTVINMPFEHDLSNLMKGRFGGVYLGEYILAGDIFIDHSVDCLYLSDDLF